MRATSRRVASVALLAALSVMACGPNGAGGTPGATSKAPTPGVTASGGAATAGPAAPTASAAPRTTSPDRCLAARQWGTGTRSGGPDAPIQDSLYNVRAGRHDDQCFDQLTFDINGYGPVGYVVRYVPVVRADASDKPVPVNGGAALQVTIRAPDYSASEHQPWREPWRVGQVLFESNQWQSLRQVKFAGTFEAHTTFAVGIRTKVPFQVSTWQDGGTLHVILKTAHQS
jgi:hypothetical protein